MPRTARAAAGGIIYHVLNRGNGRMGIFRKPGDYRAFVELLIEARERAEVELFGFCLMPNHWHLVLRPRRSVDLAAYLSWLSNTHVKRYRAHYRRTSGHLYQGRYKSLPVQETQYFLRLMRYVEGNPLRAKLVERAQDWEWSSAGCGKEITEKLLDGWPVDRPQSWLALVNRPLPAAEAKQIKDSLTRGRPFGRREVDGQDGRSAGIGLHAQTPRPAAETEGEVMNRWMSPFQLLPVQETQYFLRLMRYVEGNPLRAKLVERAQDWEWSSAGCGKEITEKLLDGWPVDRPQSWLALVNRPLPAAEAKQIKDSLTRGRPLGDEKWTAKTADRLGLDYTLNPRGRPPKPREK